jgi:hypothetical protein
MPRPRQKISPKEIKEKTNEEAGMGYARPNKEGQETFD